MSVSFPTAATLRQALPAFYRLGGSTESKENDARITAIVNTILKELQTGIFSPAFVYPQAGIAFFIVNKSLIFIDNFIFSRGSYKKVKRGLLVEGDSFKMVAVLIMRTAPSKQEIYYLKKLCRNPWASKLLFYFQCEECIFGPTQLSTILIQTLYPKGDLQMLSQKMPLNRSLLLFFFYQMLTILKCFHAMGLVHRDIKPENFLVSENYELVLADFDFTCTVPSDTELYFCGTPSSLAPEYVYNYVCKKPLKPVTTPPLDIWALGVCFSLFLNNLSLLSHALKNSEEEQKKRLFLIYEKKLQPPPQTDPLDKIVAAMLNPIPENRGTAKSLLKQLLAYIGDVHSALLELHDRDANPPPPCPLPPTPS